MHQAKKKISRVKDKINELESIKTENIKRMCEFFGTPFKHKTFESQGEKEKNFSVKAQRIYSTGAWQVA